MRLARGARVKRCEPTTTRQHASPNRAGGAGDSLRHVLAAIISDMSQFPSPYQTPTPQPYYGYAAPVDLQIPARRASTMMFVIGALLLLVGVCAGTVGGLLPQLLAQDPTLADKLPADLSPEQAQREFVTRGLGLGLVSMLLIIPAFFVRRGGLGAVITALVVTSLLLLLMGLEMLASLFLQGDPAQKFGSVCVTLIPLTLLFFQMAWLIQAARNARLLKQQHAQYAAQWEQYQQQLHAYQVQQQQQQQNPPTPPEG